MYRHICLSKVAVVQFKASIDKDENLKRIVRYVKQASRRGADLVAFPEFMMFYTQSSQTAAMLASKAENPLEEIFFPFTHCRWSNHYLASCIEARERAISGNLKS